MSVFSADVNGDGYMDVLGAGGYDITWWDLTAYHPDGSLESSILNTGTKPVWDNIEWSSITPPNTSVSFQVRASDKYVVMGELGQTR